MPVRDPGRADPLAILDPGMRPVFHQFDPLVEDPVLGEHVLAQFAHFVEDCLGVLIGLQRALVGRRADDRLADQDDREQHQLGHVAEEEQEGERIGVDVAQRPPGGEGHPEQDEGRYEVDGPHRADGLGDEHGQASVEADVLVGDLGRPALLALLHVGVGVCDVIAHAQRVGARANKSRGDYGDRVAALRFARLCSSRAPSKMDR